MSMQMQASLCYIKIEVDLNNMSEEINDEAGAVSAEHPNNPRVISEQRGKRKPSKITIENLSNKTLTNKEEKGILPKSSRESTIDIPDIENVDSGDDINFFSGNPFVEVTKGIIHLYKKNERTEIKDGLSKTLCLLAVPATLNCHDILNFVAPCHPVIQFIRIIRDGSPNQFMVLLEFRSVESATEFYTTFNGAPYNTFEPDSLCNAVWVSSINWGNDGEGIILSSRDIHHNLGLTELPTCPVCLERMDESIDGVLTILCNHAFHANCLVKWGDSTCPVCRCVQTPELTENSVCMECDGTEALWICLICGHIGCGRYQGGHAALHYHSTNHSYALQLGTNRVWDYAGDNFVHRLLQSKGDCKLVATQLPGEVEDDAKIDSMQLEYTYLLTSQLDAQREYYEEKLVKLESTIKSEFESIQKQAKEIKEKNSSLDGKVQSLTKEKHNLEKKVNQLTSKLSLTVKDLVEERHLGKALQTNQTSWQSRYNTLEAKFKEYQTSKDDDIKELKDQIRDLMFYMEAQNTIANSDLKDEIASASVTVSEKPDKAEKSKSSRRKF